MAILGIENRTENWKTAQVFAPLFPQQHRAEDARKRLAERLGVSIPDCADVSLDLFWYGIRDHGTRCGWKKNDYIRQCARAYKHLFRELRGCMEKEFTNLDALHYRVSDKAKLANNLRNTEIDIVLESQHHLFIGEAKRDEKFGGNKKLVLVHQLVRQYVAATILLDFVGKKKKIVPFVVGDDKKVLHRKKQVQFMIQCLGMRHDNVLDWDDIRQLTG